MALDLDPGESESRVRSDYMSDYAWRFALRPAVMVLLIIDMQYATGCRTEGLGGKLVEQGKEHLSHWRVDRIERLAVPNQRRLLAFLRRYGWRVLYITLGSEFPDFSDIPPHLRPVLAASNNWRGDHSHEILEEVAPEAVELVLNKTTASAFVSTRVDELLRSWGTKQLLLAGISTNICVESTGRGAADRRYECVLIDDACASAKEEHPQSCIGQLRAALRPGGNHGLRPRGDRVLLW